MLRSARISALLIRATLAGTVSWLACATATTILVGCNDESQPDYWIGKLDDSAWQPRAINRLDGFYNYAVTKANNDSEAPDVKALVDKIVDPLTKVYASGYDNLDEKTRETLIDLLTRFRDKRTEPALRCALEQFAKRGRGGRDVKSAARAAADLGLDSLADAMIATFNKVRAESPDGALAYRDLADAMIRLKSKSWVGPLASKLDPEIPVLDPAKKETFEELKNQVYWQTTAAQVLGEIGDPSAVGPLLKVLLDRNKSNVHSTALLALVKIGKPTVEPTVKLLQGQDQALSDYAAIRYKRATGNNDLPKDRPEIEIAAAVLGMLGRSEGLEPLIAALKSAQEDSTKAVLAREITKIIPATSTGKDAFKQAYESISGDAIAQQQNAIMMLTEAAGSFFDATMIDWLLERAEKVNASSDMKQGIQGVVTLTTIKLMKPEQVTAVSGAVTKYGTQIEKDAFNQAGDLLKACGEKVTCYLAELEKNENQSQKNQFIGIKAGYMLAIYGNEQTREEIVKRLDSIENAAVRFVAAEAIDRLSPNGSESTADELNRIIQKSIKSADQDRIMSDEPIKQVMYRLRSRAG